MQDNTKLPSPSDIGTQHDPYYLQFVFDARQTFSQIPFMFEYQGKNDEKPIPFSPRGGIQAVSGQKKNGKTFFLTMLAAACLEPESEHVEAKLQGLRMRSEVFIDENGNYRKPSVLYIDTEMEPINTKLLQERIHWFCGWPININNPRFHIIRLRTMPAQDSEGKPIDVPAERLKVSKYWINQYKPDLVFIDGLRDLVHDFNDNAESMQIINELMSIAETKNICIWNALHYNPRPGNDDQSKMRGHLGTELGNKVSDTFISIKKKQGNIVSFTVQQVDARSQDVSDIPYTIDQEPCPDATGKYIAVPRIGDSTFEEIVEKNITVDDIAKWLWKADIQWPTSQNIIRQKAIQEIGGVRSNTKKAEYIKMAINSRLIVPSGEKKNGADTYKLNNALKPDEL